MVPCSTSRNWNQKVNHFDKKSRCGFVVVKLLISGEPSLLLRQDHKWRDFNFLGGHEKPEDSGNLTRAARREVLEEVPQLRQANCFSLVPLTEKFSYGPIESRSRGLMVLYELQFFQLVFTEAPKKILAAITHRSSNRLLRMEDVLVPGGIRVSQLVRVLDSTIVGGLRSVGFSWPGDIKLQTNPSRQLEIPFQWREEERSNTLPEQT